METPKVAMIGAGAMGGVMAGALAAGGADLTIIDTDTAHVSAIRAQGLRVTGLDGPQHVPAMSAPEGSGWADLAVIMVPSTETATAARTARQVLKPDGSAVSCQNGLGNLEVLSEVLGAGRVFMGSTKVSADRPQPGCPRVTRIDPTTLGELDGQTRPRTDWMVRTLSAGGLPSVLTDNINGALWTKFIHNCAINALSAITGLRMGEVTRIPELGALRWQIVDEALAVAAARGVRLTDPHPHRTLKPHVWKKFTKPSMLQHIEQGRPTEIDAINGYLVREGARLGIPTPVNAVIHALALGRGAAVLRAEETLDYEAMTAAAEAEIARGETPWDHLWDHLEDTR